MSIKQLDADARLADAVIEYGDASRCWGMSLRRGVAEAQAADRRSIAALDVVLTLIHRGEDRVVPIASLAPDGAA